MVSANCQLDLALMIDESGSIQDNDPGNWNLIRQFTENLVRRLTTEVGTTNIRVALVTFGNFAVTHFYLNTHNTGTAYTNAIRGLPYLGGNTNTTGAFRQIRTDVFTPANGDRPNVQNLIIVVTDGNVTREREDFGAEVQRVKNTGATIVGVGVTQSIDIPTMRAMVTQPADEFYFFVEEFDELVNEINAILSRSCRRIPG